MWSSVVGSSASLSQRSSVLRDILLLQRTHLPSARCWRGAWRRRRMPCHSICPWDGGWLILVDFWWCWVGGSTACVCRLGDRLASWKDKKLLVDRLSVTSRKSATFKLVWIVIFRPISANIFIKSFLIRSALLPGVSHSTPRPSSLYRPMLAVGMAFVIVARRKVPTSWQISAPS